MWGTLSDEGTGLSFTIAVDPHQCSHSRVRVPWHSRPYFTVSDSRLPFSLPPMTCRAMVEVFDPTSTWEVDLCYITAARTMQKTQFYCCVTQMTHKTSHVIAVLPVHWHADCYLASSYKHSSYCCVCIMGCLSSRCLAMH
jgi:hypothetical protein